MSKSATIGDGYNGDEKPHSNGENFYGIGILTAAQLAQKGTIPLHYARLYDTIEHKMAKIVQEYFKLDRPLYPDFIRLVCRKPTDTIENDGEGNLILSHPVHPDNCIYKYDGSCPRKDPAYIWREYSGVLYLNEDVEGGEIFFADSTGKYAMVGATPKCGRLVGFCAGLECLHGVKKLKAGVRCALPVWFTTKKERVDFTLADARKIMDEVENSQRL